MAITRRVILVFAVMTGIMVMLPGQIMTDDQRRISDVETRLPKYDKVSDDVIRLEVEVTALKAASKDVKDQLDSLNNRALAVIGMAFLAILERALSAFGWKFRDKGNSAEKVGP